MNQWRRDDDKHKAYRWISTEWTGINAYFYYRLIACAFLLHFSLQNTFKVSDDFIFIMLIIMQILTQNIHTLIDNSKNILVFIYTPWNGFIVCDRLFEQTENHSLSSESMVLWFDPFDGFNSMNQKKRRNLRFHKCFFPLIFLTSNRYFTMILKLKLQQFFSHYILGKKRMIFWKMSLKSFWKKTCSHKRF